MSSHHETSEVSDWVRRFACSIPAHGRVLDLACGAGRHSRYLAELGYGVIAVDRDPAADLARVPGVELVKADLENEPWPFGGKQFSGVVVTNYLHRPLFPRLLESLSLRGVLIYETFARGNEKFGKPSNPDFLLEPGELFRFVSRKLRVLAYEDLIVCEPRPAAIQRICAIREELAPHATRLHA